MTDKAMVQIPSKYNGRINKLYFAKGDTAFVHKPLFSVEIQGSNTSAAPAVETAKAETVSTPVAANTATSGEAPVPVKAANGKAVASPAVRRLAREKGIDISLVTGTGKKGRVYKQDLETYLNQGKVEASAPAQVAQAATKASTTRVEPIRGVKAAMAKAMAESVSTIPHFTYCDEVDMTQLVALRLRLKEKYAKQDIKLTMMPFFMKAMSLALNEFPIMNSQPNAECTELTYFDDHNIGMAVDSKVGLLVPNVKQCQDKSILDLAKAVTALTNSAREGRVSPDDLKGGTITISNIGALGGTVATPIINKPEVAIVALGKVQQLPRFNDKGEVEACTIMQVSWSGDHRIIDGGTIARFVNLWKSYLEDPSEMLVAMS
jgi:2-oxoisovalerate dehydrogenase E2 component (dihydrolipoyl transacylase)